MEVSLELNLQEEGFIEAILFDRKILPHNGFGLHYLVWHENEINGLTTQELRSRTNEWIRTKRFETEMINICYTNSKDTPYKDKNEILVIDVLPGSNIISIEPKETESLDFSIDSRIRALIQRFHKKPLINPPELVADIIGLLTCKD
ncbi:hypothetical protein HYT58_02945 [Candidatus Woesearchaeota archaeon]|nr:hypothetical protein [Candidatus Woesearchaeota archaeon]